jgi:hypothetical protein
MHEQGISYETAWNGPIRMRWIPIRYFVHLYEELRAWYLLPSGRSRELCASRSAP